MSILVKNTTVNTLKVKTSSATLTVPYAMARSERESSYLEYNWAYVHGVPAKITDSNVTVAGRLRTFVLMGRDHIFDISGNHSYHIVIGYSSFDCYGPTTGSSHWVDIIVRGDGTKWAEAELGPGTSPNATLKISVEDLAPGEQEIMVTNPRMYIPITVYYPVVGLMGPSYNERLYKLHGIYERS